MAEVAEEVLPVRRDRINPRVIKQKMTNWAKMRSEHRHYPQATRGFAESIVMRRWTVLSISELKSIRTAVLKGSLS